MPNKELESLAGLMSSEADRVKRVRYRILTGLWCGEINAAILDFAGLTLDDVGSESWRVATR